MDDDERRHLGTPSEIALVGDGRRWWGGVYKAVVVVRWCVHKSQGGGGVLGQKPVIWGMGWVLLTW
jgi:hypothetical protein